MYDVTEVQCKDGYVLELTFDNGDKRNIDVSTLVPFDGVFEPLKNKEFFGKVRVDPDVGTVVWPNGADLCPDVLYDQSRPSVRR